jgi:hypothetical protein
MVALSRIQVLLYFTFSRVSALETENGKEDGEIVLVGDIFIGLPDLDNVRVEPKIVSLSCP